MISKQAICVNLWQDATEKAKQNEVEKKGWQNLSVKTKETIRPKRIEVKRGNT
jgi:hypothetical protein